MKKLFFVMIMIFSLNSLASAKIKVVTSITPIASLFAMVGGDDIDITILSKSDGCPHHHSLKPSELRNIENADILAFIDKNFEGFMIPVISKSNGRIFEISKIPNLIVSNNNWHIWLLPSNTMLILKSILELLVELRPENVASFQNNYDEGIRILKGLENKRLSILKINVSYILLSHSAEYLFYNFSNIKKMYQSDYTSIKNLNILEKEKVSDQLCCFVLDANQHMKTYSNLLGTKAHIISINAENWSNSYILDSLYYNEYDKILDTIASCKKDSF